MLHELAISLLGPYAALPPAAMLLLVWLNRRALRKRHVVMLFALTALGVVVLSVVAVLALFGWDGNPTLFLGAMYGSAALSVGCGPATTLAWVLNAYFPSDEAKAEEPIPMPQRPPRWTKQ